MQIVILSTRSKKKKKKRAKRFRERTNILTSIVATSNEQWSRRGSLAGKNPGDKLAESIKHSFFVFAFFFCRKSLVYMVFSGVGGWTDTVCGVGELEN